MSKNVGWETLTVGVAIGDDEIIPRKENIRHEPLMNNPSVGSAVLVSPEDLAKRDEIGIIWRDGRNGLSSRTPLTIDRWNQRSFSTEATLPDSWPTVLNSTSNLWRDDSIEEWNIDADIWKLSKGEGRIFGRGQRDESYHRSMFRFSHRCHRSCWHISNLHFGSLFRTDDFSLIVLKRGRRGEEKCAKKTLFLRSFFSFIIH